MADEPEGSGSRYQVALELMRQISHKEQMPQGEARKYFLDLYVACLRATREISD